MSFYRSFVCSLGLWFVLQGVAAAEGFVLGAGAEGDTVDGRSVSAFGDFGFTETTWVSLTASSSQVEGIQFDSNTVYVDGGLDHFFDPFGVRVGAAFWGDDDILSSNDVRGSVYLRGDRGSVSLDFERRDFEFDLQSDLLRGRTVEFSADGLGLAGRLNVGETVTLHVGGMRYDYSRNIRVQQDIDVLTFLARSRLSMINSLIDHRINAGLEYRFGLRSVDVTAGRWQTAVDGGTVDSISVGMLTPVSDRTDLEFRLSFDDSENFGSATAFSFYLYYFGGS